MAGILKPNNPVSNVLINGTKKGINTLQGAEKGVHLAKKNVRYISTPSMYLLLQGARDKQKR